jgi:hypothetical protein
MQVANDIYDGYNYWRKQHAFMDCVVVIMNDIYDKNM